MVKQPLNHRFKVPAIALAVSGFALTGSVSFAQEAEDDVRVPRSGLDTIVVQAQKRTEDTQTVPIAVTAVTGKALEQRFAQDFRDLTSAAPNVLLEPVGSFQNASSFFIRGTGSSDIESAADPGIAVLIDGVYQARTSTALVDFLDVSAVEVLRGPQGTLFGRNAIGGAVLLRHNAPDVNDFGADFSLTAGQYGRFDVKGMANLVLAEGKSAFRVAFKSTSLDGYYTNIYNGRNEDAGEQDRFTLLPSFRFQTDNLDIVIRGEYNRTRDDAYPTVVHNACVVDPAGGDEWFNLLGGNDLVIAQTVLNLGGEAARELCAFEEDDTDRAYTINNNNSFGDGSQFDVWGLTGEVNYDIADVGRITYIGNYRDVEENIQNDFDGTPLELFETVREQWHYQTSHELRFASEFSDMVDFVAGVFYFKQHYLMHQNGRGQVFGPLFQKINGHAFGRSEQWHEQWAVFAQANWHITDQLTLVTGARYTDETKDFLHCGVGFGDAETQTCDFDNKFLSFNSDTDIGDGVKSNGVDQNPGTNSWSNLSPKVALNYQVHDNLFTYASWTRGFRSGGFNGRGNTPQTAGPFDEEKADSFEAGIKWDGMDNRLRVNLVGFWTEFDNLQRSIIRPSGGSGGQETVTENAAKARSRGFELEVTAIPTDGLTLGMAVGYLDATTLEWCADLNGPLVDTPAANEDCGVAVPLNEGILQPFQNNNMPILRAPKWTLNLNASYEFALGNNGFVTVSADYLHRSSMSLIGAGFPPGDPSNLGKLNYNGIYTTAKRKSTDVLNLQATWEDVDSRYHVSVFWKNVTKETYINSGTYVAGLFNFAQRNVPRHWGIEVGFRL